MAKKSKKQKSNGKLFLAIALLFGIASIFMILLPAIKVIDTDTAYTGLQVVFGYENKETLGDKKSVTLRFNLSSFDHTLTGEEIEKFRKELEEFIARNGLEMRG